MSTAQIETIDKMFDNHPSLSASLEDFEHNEQRSPVFRVPSHHSGFRSDESDAGQDSVSDGPWSPPGWRNQSTGSAWYRHQPYLQESRLRLSASPAKSRERSSPGVKSDDDPTLPANIPLPRGSLSPMKEMSPGPAPASAKVSEPPRPARVMSEPPPDSHDNYFRFAVRAEVQQRTEPVEMVITWIRTRYQRITRSKSTFALTILVALLSMSLFRILTRGSLDIPSPDVVKVAGLARSFEPLIYYSENGISHIADLQETGVAVWDLGESVRAANMTSTPIIVQELDGLSESLKTLSYDLTTFFAEVDGDIDNILLVMDWAKRELAALGTSQAGGFSSAVNNVHGLLARVGMLTDAKTGEPTATGTLLAKLFGRTSAQRARHTLSRTFKELLGTLEASINSELTSTTRLFSIFAQIDQQFKNLHRSAIREFDTQDKLEGEILSSLWSRVIGAQSSKLRKFEKNKALLQSVRERTLVNKNMLVEHNGKLMALKQNLEILRQRLVSPLVRGGEGSTGTVDMQIKGLEATYDHLRLVRESQKGRVMETLYGRSGSRRRSYEIDG